MHSFRCLSKFKFVILMISGKLHASLPEKKNLKLMDTKYAILFLFGQNSQQIILKNMMVKHFPLT